jgi:colicin import membrane protein
MPIPTQGFFDHMDTDSVRATQERADRLREQMAEQAREREAVEERRREREEAQEKTAREEEIEALERVSKLSKNVDSRDALLERIREMRKEVPAPPKPMPLTDAMRKRIEEEQEAGRRAVAFHQAEIDAAQARRREIAQAEAQAATEPTMTSVVTPNPGMKEQYPTAKKR